MTDLVELADLAGLYRRFEWAERAACRGYPQEWWFPERGEPVQRALDRCAVCPVRDECREQAYRNGEKGIWGGETGKARRDAIAAGRRVPLGRKPQPINHGTVGGYRAHQRRGVPMCDDCRRAESRRKADVKARKAAVS